MSDPYRAERAEAYQEGWDVGWEHGYAAACDLYYEITRHMRRHGWERPLTRVQAHKVQAMAMCSKKAPANSMDIK